MFFCSLSSRQYSKCVVRSTLTYKVKVETGGYFTCVGNTLNETLWTLSVDFRDQKFSVGQLFILNIE